MRQPLESTVILFPCLKLLKFSDSCNERKLKRVETPATHVADLSVIQETQPGITTSCCNHDQFCICFILRQGRLCELINVLNNLCGHNSWWLCCLECVCVLVFHTEREHRLKVLENRGLDIITLILRRSRTGTVWFYTSTSNKRAARPKLYTKSLTRDLKLMYSRFTLVRISINL